MDMLVIAFITGATSGSLGCLASQGGLLTALIPGPSQAQERPAALGIGLFLAAKLLAYTALGALLGAFGSVLHLSVRLQAGLLIGIGLFMVLNGFRLLDLHPLLRRCVIETPATLRRFIRQHSGRGWMAPLILGLLTIFLPCGVAQAMMATALASGHAGQGAALLFAFTLGGVPLFFGLTYLAVRLSGLRLLTPAMAMLLIALGMIPINQGLTLAGSRYSGSRLLARLRDAHGEPRAASALEPLVIQVGEGGYSPQVLHARAGQILTLTWVTEGTETCARSVVMRGLDTRVALPSRGRVPCTLPPQAKGTRLDYTCAMGMYAGQIVFDKE